MGEGWQQDPIQTPERPWTWPVEPTRTKNEGWDQERIHLKGNMQTGLRTVNGGAG